MQTDSLLREIIPLIKRAGQFVLELYYTDYIIEIKHDQSPVTEADIGSDRIIKRGLQTFGYPILSEESADDPSRLRSDRVWIVDSLDGTNGYISKTGEFAVMIGLAEKGEAILGLVYLPADDKLYYASKGEGAYMVVGDREPTRLGVSSQADIHEATLVVSRSHLSESITMASEKLAVRDLRQHGSNGVKMGLVAEGKADLYFNPTDQMGQWDLCAPQIIVEEAGGQVSGIHGERLQYNLKNSKNPYGIVASNGKLHSSVLNFFGGKKA